MKQPHPSTQPELEICMRDLKFITEYWENILTEELHSAYGNTPEWYAHSMHFGTSFNSSCLNAGMDMPYPEYSETNSFSKGCDSPISLPK
jgi:hypothetical protein